MIRNDLIAELARRADIPHVRAHKIVDVMLSAIEEAVAKGLTLQLRGFGTFSTRERAPVSRQNPRTGVCTDVPAKRTPVFRAGTELLARVDEVRSERPLCSKSANSKTSRPLRKQP